ncbi:MAG: hypothetical protein Q9213_004645 [Squamulea squamosa]
MAQDPRALLQKADKAAQGAGGGFSFFGGRSEKWENAADLYTQAANAFRMQKQGTEAGQAFERAASIQTSKLSEPDDAANSLTEAYKSYRKSSPQDAARVLSQAISHYTTKGNFRRAATNQQNLAELYELEVGDEKAALEAYEVAAGWFEGDNAEALANKLFLKVGDLAAIAGDYHKAVEQYEKVARSSVSNNLMKWSVKDYFLKAGICHLASGDTVATSRALESYRDLDPTFPSTREHQLLVDLAEAVEQGDQEVFAEKLFQAAVEGNNVAKRLKFLGTSASLEPTAFSHERPPNKRASFYHRLDAPLPIVKMKLNISYPSNGTQKLIEIDDERKLRVFMDRRMGQEVPGDSVGPEFKGYVFRITGGNDKQGFPMKQGIMHPTRVRLLLSAGRSCYRPRRTGERRRKSVRGCIVGMDLSVLALSIVKQGDEEIPGVTDKVLPKRLGPKRATKIRKFFGLSKEDDVRKFVIRREVQPKGEGKKPYTKAPRIQRLVTPQRLQHKRHRMALKRRKAEASKDAANEYAQILAKRVGQAKAAKDEARKRRASSKK